MEINRIDETSEAAASQEIGLSKLGGKPCIYYPEVSCRAPKLRFKICNGCPRCQQFAQQNVVKSVFNHIKSFAVSLLATGFNQSSK
ncbi:MAG: hypothetical protein KJ732_05450 [Candidatus Margulisbacteria bacterium]|nr:hypothetical protein [Candidatus Margulisiibacteriota bacterium]